MYLSPESTIIVATVFPGPNLSAILRAATIFAPVYVPAKIPSSLAERKNRPSPRLYGLPNKISLLLLQFWIK